MEVIKLWMKLNHGRITRLLEIIGISRQCLHQSLKNGWTFKPDKLNRFYDAMCQIENEEMNNKHMVKRIVANALDNFDKHDFYKQEFFRWSQILK